MGVAAASTTHAAKGGHSRRPAPAATFLARPTSLLLTRTCECGATAGLSGHCGTCDRASLGSRSGTGLAADAGVGTAASQSAVKPAPVVVQKPPSPAPPTVAPPRPGVSGSGRGGDNAQARPTFDIAPRPAVTSAPVVRQTSPVRVQTEMRVSSPADPAEREAHSVGKMIARMPDPDAQGPSVQGSASGTAQRDAAPPISDRSAAPPTAHRFEAGGQADPHVLADLRATSSGGASLPADIRSFMEPRFRADFSGVRIHTDAHAATLAAQLSARAFTIGKDIYFARGQFRPHSAEGWELIAHELTHTIQQGGVQRPPPVPSAAPKPVAPASPAAPRTAAPAPSVGAKPATGAATTPAASPAPASRVAPPPAAAAAAPAAGPIPAAGGAKTAPGNSAGAGGFARPVSSAAISVPASEAAGGIGPKLPTPHRPIRPAPPPHAPPPARPVAAARAPARPVPVAAARPAHATAPARAAAVPAAGAAPAHAAGHGHGHAAAPAHAGEPVHHLATSHAPAPGPAPVPAQVAERGQKPPAPRAAAPVRAGTPSTVAERAPVSLQRLGISDALGFFADKANLIPGFRMLTIILGVNPINMSPVDRSAANILRAVIEFIPGGGLITQALDNSGVFEKVGAWVAEQIAAVATTGAALKQAVTDFFGTLSWSDIFDLSGVWERAKRIFTEPIGRLIDFAKGLVSAILKFIKDAILLPLAKLAEGTRGWDLLIGVLGRNPITGEAVPRTPELLIGGFLKLIGQEEIWENMKKSNAIQRAWVWFQGALNTVVAFVSQIPELFTNAFKSLTIEDVVLVMGAFRKVASVFGDFLGKFIDWAGTAIWNLLEIIFDVVSPGAFTYVKKTGAALKSILKDPLPFVHNLVAAAKLGLSNFADNFGTHLKEALIDWLVGSLPGIYIPKTFSLLEFGKFALSILGITWAQIRAKIVKALGPSGETIMKGLELAFDVIKALVTGGIAAVWELIKEKLTNLKDMVIDGIVGFVTDTIVKKAIPKLVSLFVPGAGFISAIVSIYDTIKVFLDKLAKIAAVVKSFIDSIVAIAGGEISGAAKRVESALTGVLSLAISFLAGFLGLGDIAAKIMEVVKKVQAAVDKALDAGIAWIVDKAKALFGALKGAISRWWEQRKQISTDSGEKHSLYYSGKGSSAQLMVASAPRTVADFVSSKQDEAKTDPAKAAAITAINAQLAIIAGLEKLPEAEQTQRENEFTAAFNAIGDQLVPLLSGGDWGSEQNPLPLDYPKRRAAAYPVIYAGPRSANKIPQSLLKENNTAEIRKLLAPTETWDGQVVAYNPLSRQDLPGGGERIGLTADNQIAVGAKVQYDPGKTGGGGKINKALKPYGYSAQAEGRDGDHVIERQLGGPDSLENLWPLDLGENRSSGSVLSKAQVEVEGKPMGLKDGRDKRQKEKSAPLWLIIKSTKDAA